MNRITALIITLLIFFIIPAPTAESYGEGSPQVVWQALRLGKPTGELQLGPNGLFYLPVGNTLVVVDDHGRKLYEAAGPSGSSSGRPVFDAFGSIFFPGNALIQEIKVNGSNGWNFSAYQAQSKSAAQLTAGPGSLLYLPLPAALYAIDTAGRYKWTLLQWDSGDANRTQAVSGREILACAGNSQAVFIVLGEKKKGFSLVAVSGEGKIIWRYRLGDIKAANLVPGPEGWLYVTVNPAKLDPLNRGKVYAFDSKGDGRPCWSYSVPYDNLTAPTLSNHGLLYFCAGERLYAVNQAEGTEAWYIPLSKAVSRPAVDETRRRVYLGTDDKRLLAVTPQGRLDWQLDLDGKTSYGPMMGPAGDLYVVTDAGTLYKIKDKLPVPKGE